MRTTGGRQIMQPLSIRTLSIFLFLLVFLVPCLPARGFSAQDEISSDTTAAQETGPVRVAIDLEKGGRVILEMLTCEAPLAVERFLELVREGFYDGNRFHRVESYLVQAGKKEHEYPPITGEMFEQNLRHEVGMVGMARLPTDYDSQTTQFYIMKKYKPMFNGEYTIFAKVVEGMDLVGKIKKNHKIETITILD